MTTYMERRKFIAALGGAAVAWPLAASAQQPERVRRIGVLIGRGETDPDGQEWAASFERGLKELGWIPGQNALIDYRWQTSDSRQRAALASEVVALRPDILVASTTQYLDDRFHETYPLQLATLGREMRLSRG